MKRRILFVVDNLNLGGVQSFVMNAFRYLKSQGDNIDFAICSDEIGFFEKEAISSNSNIYHLPPLTLKNLGIFKNKYKSIFEKNSYSAVHVHMNFLSIFPLKYTPKNCVRILHAHASYPPSGFKAKIFRRYFQINIKRYSSYCFACSEAAGKWLYGKNAFIVFQNGIDVPKYAFNQESRIKTRKALNFINNEKVIVNVGSLVAIKRQDFLIDAFEKAVKRKPDLKLIIVGEGPEREKLHFKIKVLNLENSVFLLGAKADVENYLSASDVFVLSSLYEGSPVSIVEAVANDMPVLVSETIETNQLLNDNIHKCNFVDEQKAADAIIECCETKRNHIKWIDKFNCDELLKEMSEYYDK